MKRIRLARLPSTYAHHPPATPARPGPGALPVALVSTSASRRASHQHQHASSDFFTPHFPYLSQQYQQQQRLQNQHLLSRGDTGGDDDCDADGEHKHGGGQGGGLDEHGRLTEHEYQVRLGRAIQLLRATLPDFMSVGLADYPSPSPPTAHAVPILDPLALVSLAPTLRRRIRSGSTKAATYDTDEAGGFGSIYHPDVLFEFMPSLSPPSSQDSRGAHEAGDDLHTSPTDGASSNSTSSSARIAHAGSNRSAASQDELEGRPSFSFSGRTLYLASSHVLRHALKALFSEAHVSLDRLHLVRAGSSRSGGFPNTARGVDPEGGTTSPPPLPGESTGPSSGKRSTSSPSLSSSEAPTGSGSDELIARLTFTGLARVTHQPHEYTVLFRYTLDRSTGQIVRHRVERIQPEVGRSFWTGLSTAWFRLAPHMYPGSVVHCAAAPASASATSAPLSGTTLTQGPLQSAPAFLPARRERSSLLSS